MAPAPVAAPLGHHRARHDHEQVRAEGRHLLRHLGLGALAERDGGDHRRDGDDDAQHGEGGAELVPAQRRGARCAGRGRGSRRRLRARGEAPLRHRRVGEDEAVLEDDLRRACSAMSGSCVTSRMVSPSSLRAWKSAITSIAGGRVEVAGGLVGEEQLRPVHERPRDGDPLLLPSGELGRGVVQPVRKPHPLQRLGGARVPLRVGMPWYSMRQLDVLERARARQQVEALEDEAERAAAGARRAHRGRGGSPPRRRGSSCPPWVGRGSPPRS